MPEHRLAAGRLARVARLIRIAGIAALFLVAVLPGSALAASRDGPPTDRVVIADVPPGGGEDCVDDPDAQPGVGLRECPKGFDIATLLPFVAGGVGLVLAVAVGWFLMMRRRVSRPFLADEAVGAGGGGTGAGSGSGEWWTCKSCSSTNLAESARCYSCGSWRR